MKFYIGLILGVLLITPVELSDCESGLDFFNFFRRLGGIYDSIIKNTCEKSLIILENAVKNSKVYNSYSPEKKKEVLTELSKFSSYFSLSDGKLQVQNYTMWMARLFHVQDYGIMKSDENILEIREKLQKRVDYFCNFLPDDSAYQKLLKNIGGKIGKNIQALAIQTLFPESLKENEIDVDDDANALGSRVKKLLIALKKDGSMNLGTPGKVTRKPLPSKLENFLKKSGIKKIRNKTEPKLRSNGSESISVTKNKGQPLPSGNKLEAIFKSLFDKGPKTLERSGSGEFHIRTNNKDSYDEYKSITKQNDSTSEGGDESEEENLGMEETTTESNENEDLGDHTTEDYNSLVQSNDDESEVLTLVGEILEFL